MPTSRRDLTANWLPVGLAFPITTHLSLNPQPTALPDAAIAAE